MVVYALNKEHTPFNNAQCFLTKNYFQHPFETMSLCVGWYYCSCRMSIFFLLIHNTGKCMHTVQVEVDSTSDEVDNDSQPAGRDEACERVR